ncbi:MAG: hypothetical protein C5B49_03750 [Bdellovibrio sp.]|nr:MAG: hypothetical protein C5B49_03750 [Bdellovibrio sp.]
MRNPDFVALLPGEKSLIFAPCESFSFAKMIPSLSQQPGSSPPAIEAGALWTKPKTDSDNNLLKLYGSLEGEARAELLRKYGLYDSDFARWLDKTDSAALVALSTRKPRSDKKSPEQLEIERLKEELRGQEKTIAKLSALVVVQKKVSDFLKRCEED